MPELERWGKRIRSSGSSFGYIARSPRAWAERDPVSKTKHHKDVVVGPKGKGNHLRLHTKKYAKYLINT